MPESFYEMEIELNLLTMCIQCGIIEIESGKFFLILDVPVLRKVEYVCTQ